MSQQVRYQLWIAAAACVIFFTHLGAAGLWDMDEALYTSCAREMVERGDWVVPWFNGEMFPEKPPLMFWTMMAGFELFGINEWGARFFSAVMGAATAILAFHLGRLLFNASVGLWTGLVTVSTIIFTISARAATVDAALTFFTTLAMLLFVIAWQRSQRGESTGPRGDWLLFAGMYASIGVTVLGKGPVGMLLPLAAMGLFLVVTRGWRRLLSSMGWMRPCTGLLVTAAVALPWYVWVGVRTDGEWLRVFFLEFNLRPFKQPILGHGDTSALDRTWAAIASLLYYFFQIPAILVGFFPWSVFLGPTLVDAAQRLREAKKIQGPAQRKKAAASETDSSWRDGYVLALCWFFTWFVFWSVCKTKLPHYLLPAYPAMALLTACFVDRWLDNATTLRDYWLRNAWISTILVGTGFLVVIPFVAAQYLPGDQWLGLVGLPLIVGGIACWRATLRCRRRQAAWLFAATSVVFLTAMFGFAAQAVDRHQNARPMTAAIRADAPESALPPIATYRFFRESTVYYTGYPVTKCDDNTAAGQSARKSLEEFLKQRTKAYVITTDEYEKEIAGAFPGRLSVIFRQRRFLGPGEMIVLRSEPRDGATPSK